MQAFADSWEDLDQEGTGFVETQCLTALLQAIDPPMGVRGLTHVSKRIQEIVQQTSIPIRSAPIMDLDLVPSMKVIVQQLEIPVWLPLHKNDVVHLAI